MSRWTESNQRCACGTLIAVNNQVPVDRRKGHGDRVQSTKCFRCRAEAIYNAPRVTLEGMKRT